MGGTFNHMFSSSCYVAKSGLIDAIAHPALGGESGVLAVVVLYNRAFKDVPCAPRLMQWLAAPVKASARLNLAHCLIYDNSPVSQLLDCGVHERIDLFHDASNGGTRAAYLYALKIAKKKGYPWILFLDHDTDLPQDFFLDAERALATAPAAPICAVVPRVFDGLTLISPSKITSFGRVYSLQDGHATHNSSDELTAIASASIVRTESLAAVLPIPAAFSLDYLDHWLFRELQRRGECIAVSSARVEHSLSVQSMKSMGIDRYRSILAAELAFLRSGPRYSPFLHLIWHMGRTIKLMLSTRRPALVGVCARAALNILRTK
jgi:GT2 family glycosyltransferase